MKKHIGSMKGKMISMLIICWMIPLVFMLAVMGFYIVSNHSDMTAQNYMRQLRFNNQICIERLNQAVTDSRQLSYDGEILSIRKDYMDGKLRHDRSYRSYKTYLESRYSRNPGVSAALLFLEREGAEDESCFIYSPKAGGSYQQLVTYQNRDEEKIRQIISGLDTKTRFAVCDGTLYLVRNLLDSHYEVQGFLVLILNQEHCFQSVIQYSLQEEVCISISGEEEIHFPANQTQENWPKLFEEMKDDAFLWKNNRLYVADEADGDRYHLQMGMKLDESVNRYPFYGYPYLMIVMAASLILMLVIMLIVLEKRVNRPLQAVRDGAGRIENGELGYQIEDVVCDREFDALISSVNQMSEHLKQQFQKIYEEEIALQEARIMALQSHINPHFMNNTLEIINWEVRLGNNETAGGMIEALSVMLDAAMDRRKKPKITLTEEMQYVNSYLYIMKQRLGDRLKVDISIDESAMQLQVPRLILQPILENAMEHGAAAGRGDGILIRGYRNGAFLHLDVINEGHLTPEEEAKIERLLDPEYDTSKEKSGNLGIANVNQRLRILFGEPCGLQIMNGDDGCIVARLMIPWEENPQI